MNWQRTHEITPEVGIFHIISAKASSVPQVAVLIGSQWYIQSSEDWLSPIDEPEYWCKLSKVD